MIERSTIYHYIHDKYGTCPDTPFRKFPSYEAFRHSDNRKIYGLIMDVKRKKLGIEGPPKEYVDKDTFSIRILKEHGVTTVRGPRSVPASLLQEVNHYLN